MTYPLWVGKTDDRNFELSLGRYFPDGRGHLQIATFASEGEAVSARSICDGITGKTKYETRLLMKERLRAAGM